MKSAEFNELRDRLNRAEKLVTDCARLEQAVRDLRGNIWPYDVLRKLTGLGADSVADPEELNPFIEQGIIQLLRKRQRALDEI